MIEPGMMYKDFFDTTLQAGKSTALLDQEKPAGWSVFSKDILMPAIEEKNKLLHNIQHLHTLSLDKT